MNENNNEDVILNDNNEGENLLNTESDTETIRKSLATEIARKKHFREKYEKSSTREKELEAKTKSYEEQIAKFTNKTTEAPEISSRVEQLERQLEKSKFANKHQLSDEETDLVYSYASGTKVTPEQAKDNPYIKTAIESVRSQRRAETATPSSSTTMKFESGKKWEEMNEEERKKNFSKFSDKMMKK